MFVQAFICVRVFVVYRGIVRGVRIVSIVSFGGDKFENFSFYFPRLRKTQNRSSNNDNNEMVATQKWNSLFICACAYNTHNIDNAK